MSASVFLSPFGENSLALAGPGDEQARCEGDNNAKPSRDHTRPTFSPAFPRSRACVCVRACVRACVGPGVRRVYYVCMRTSAASLTTSMCSSRCTLNKAALHATSVPRFAPRVFAASRRLPLLAARQRGLSTPASGRTLLAALVERSPVLTPDLPDHETKHATWRARLEALHKTYPAVLTQAEEGPDQQRARERAVSIVDDWGTREGEGDRSGDETSLDRRLSQRVYLLVRVDGKWVLPQREWAGPPETSRDVLNKALEAACGTDIKLHPTGNAPFGHLPNLAGGSTTFLWRYLHVAGDVQPGSEVDQHAWLTKAELVEHLDEPLGQLVLDICGPYD